ncbi:MAG: hypothetical protein IKI95_01515 [Clostridia bacterium]|nr:hypothetical protein [Clostridia bacterium]
MNYIRTVNFSNSTNLLQNSDIKNAIKQCLGLGDSSYYERLQVNPLLGYNFGFKIKFDLICDSDNVVIINGQPQNLIAGTAYSSEHPVDIHSLTLETSGSGTISMDIRR